MVEILPLFPHLPIRFNSKQHPPCRLTVCLLDSIGSVHAWNRFPKAYGYMFCLYAPVNKPVPATSLFQALYKCEIHSFIHTEHLYNASSRELLRLSCLVFNGPRSEGWSLHG